MDKPKTPSVYGLAEHIFKYYGFYLYNLVDNIELVSRLDGFNPHLYKRLFNDEELFENAQYLNFIIKTATLVFTSSDNLKLQRLSEISKIAVSISDINLDLNFIDLIAQLCIFEPDLWGYPNYNKFHNNFARYYISHLKGNSTRLDYILDIVVRLIYYFGYGNLCNKYGITEHIHNNYLESNKCIYVFTSCKSGYSLKHIIELYLNYILCSHCNISINNLYILNLQTGLIYGVNKNITREDLLILNTEIQTLQKDILNPFDIYPKNNYNLSYQFKDITNNIVSNKDSIASIEDILRIFGDSSLIE